MANYSNNLGQIRLGWRTAVSTTPVNTNDVDATAFITAAGITDSTQISALNTLVNDLKTYGLWTKMKAIYPFVGGTSEQHRFNLKNTANYKLTFSGGWAHSSTGALSNGTTGYADTQLSPSLVLSVNNAHTSIYVNNNPVAYTSHPSFGCMDVTNNTKTFYTNLVYSNNYYSFIGDEKGSATYGVTYNNTDSKGFYLASRTSSTMLKGYKNAVLKATNTLQNTGTLPTPNYYYGGVNNGTAGLLSLTYNNYSHAFASIGDSLSDTDASNFYISVQKFQTTLGRHVGTPYVSDPDAIAFLMAAGITDGTQAAAINTLVIRMKADGVWTKMRAIYPFVGGSSTSHKWNLKDPRDLDAAYRLVFNGGGTHTSNGYKGNGSNSYADSKFPANILSPGNAHLSFYNRTTVLGSGYVSAIQDNSSWDTNKTVSLGVGNSGNGGVIGGYFAGAGVNSTTIKTTAWTSLTLVTTTSTNLRKVYNSGIVQGSSTTNSTNTFSTSNLVIGAHAGAFNYVGAYETSFVSFGDGLTDTDATNLYSAVQSFQTTLGRQVNVPLVSDTDAQAFLNAANITSFQQASAVNKLVVDLKAAGVWTKMKAIYPFVGGSAASHKFNLKDPRDLDAAYRLVFNGGWTHTSTGAQPNGTTGYADTKLSPISALTIANHFSFYNNGTISNTQTTIDIGSGNGDPNAGELYLWTYREDGTMKYDNGSSVTNRVSASTTSKGFSLGTRTSNTSQKIYKNGNLLATNTNVNVNSLPYPNIYIGGGNINGTSQYPSSKQTAFASIGDGLTDAESTALYTAVQTYQTSLGRSVDTPVYNNGLVLNLDAGNANSYPGTGTTWFDLASGNNGTLTNGPTYDTTSGGVITFDGINDYIDFGLSNINLPTNITLSAWINQSSPLKMIGNIITKEGSGQTDLDYGLTTSPNGNLYFWFNNGSYRIHETSTNVINSTNTWYNVVSVFDDTNNRVKMYVNGVEVYNQPETTSLLAHTNSKLWIGWRNSLVSGQLFYGSISSTQIYNRALSETEILNNFNSTRGRFGI